MTLSGGHLLGQERMAGESVFTVVAKPLLAIGG